MKNKLITIFFIFVAVYLGLITYKYVVEGIFEMYN